MLSKPSSETRCARRARVDSILSCAGFTAPSYHSPLVHARKNCARAAALLAAVVGTRTFPRVKNSLGSSLTLLALALVGCGGSDDQQKAGPVSSGGGGADP